MNKSIWDWLEIEPTKDINEIKTAYAKAAKKYHPTEHPEKFKKLRDCYKLAIELSKEDNSTFNTATFIVEQDIQEKGIELDKKIEKNIPELKYNLGSRKEKNLKSNFGKGNREKGSLQLDFSKVSLVEELNKRQKNMLVLLESMLSFTNLNPEVFGSEKVIKAITYNWDKSPYKEEITPTFVSALVDILKSSSILDIDAYNAIEKCIWDGRKRPEFEAFRMQFLSIKNESCNAAHKKIKISNEQIENCFHKLKNGSTPRLLFEPSSKLIGVFKKKFHLTLLNNMLLIAGRKVRYYFCDDLSYDINRITDQLKIYDHEKKVILTVPAHNNNYRLILEHLNRNNCTYLGELKLGESVFIKKADNIIKVRIPSQNDRNVNLKKTITLPMIGVCLYVIDYFLKPFSNGIFHAAYYMIKGAGYYVWILSGFYFVSYLSQLVKNDKLLFNTTDVGKELKNDIKNGNLFYVIGTGLYIFERYIVYLSKTSSYVIPIREIQWFDQTIRGDLDFIVNLRICYNNGQMISINIFSADAVNETVDYINSKRIELVKYTETEEIRLKYEKLKYEKPGISRIKFLFVKKLKEMYRSSYILFGISVIMLLISALGGLGGHIWESNYNFDAIAFYAVVVVLAIWSGHSLYSFHKYPVELIVDIGMQMLKKNRYFNPFYSIYVLDDYFVSCSKGVLKIIPLSEVESVNEGRGLTSHLLKMKLKDGENKTFCRKVTNYQDGNAIREIIRNIEGRLAC